MTSLDDIFEAPPTPEEIAAQPTYLVFERDLSTTTQRRFAGAHQHDYAVSPLGAARDIADAYGIEQPRWIVAVLPGGTDPDEAFDLDGEVFLPRPGIEIHSVEIPA